MDLKATSANDHANEGIVDEARSLLAATAEAVGEDVSAARKRLSAALDSGKRILGKVKEKAVDGAKATDAAIHEYPYASIGIAVGVGALIGFLVSRRMSSKRD